MLAPRPGDGQDMRLAVLDIDGTLTDTVALHQAAMLCAMESFCFPNLNRDWSTYRHHTDTGIFEEAWRRAGWMAPSHADRLGFARSFETAFEALLGRHPIREIPGARSFVQALRDQGWAFGQPVGDRRLPGASLWAPGSRGALAIPFARVRP